MINHSTGILAHSGHSDAQTERWYLIIAIVGLTIVAAIIVGGILSSKK